MEPQARVDRAEQAQAIGNDTRRRVGSEGVNHATMFRFAQRNKLRSHAYSRKYSRFARLDATLRLGFKTPYFRNVTSKKDTQSFFEVPLPTSLSSVVVSA